MAARNYINDDRHRIQLEENFGDADDRRDAMYLGVIRREAPAEPKPLSSRTMSIFLHDAAGRGTPIEPGFLNKTEIHIICPPVPGLLERSFVAHYTRFNHSLELRMEMVQAPAENFFICQGLFMVGLSTSFNPLPNSPSSSDTGVTAAERSPEVGQAMASEPGAPPPLGWEAPLLERNLEVGQAVASVTFAAAALGWEARLLGPSLGFKTLTHLMGLTSERDLANELPVAAILVFPAPVVPLGTIGINTLKARILGRFTRLLWWRGRPYGVIKPGEHSNSVCRHVAMAEMTDGDEHVRVDKMHHGLTGKDFKYKPRVTLRRALNSRGGVALADLDEDYTMSQGRFQQFLLRCCHGERKENTRIRRSSFPCGVLPWLPRVNMFIFVNRVKGFQTGLYGLVRNQRHFERSYGGGSSSSDTPYHWKPETLGAADDPVPFSYDESFFLLRPAPEAQYKKSAFLVVMVAPFMDVTEDKDLYMFSRQIWEAGFLGEVLAVEAQAQGLSAFAVNSQDYDWQRGLGINIGDGNIISVYAVGRQKRKQIFKVSVPGCFGRN